MAPDPIRNGVLCRALLSIRKNDQTTTASTAKHQAAVALHHASRANSNGARSLFRRMKANLDGYRPAYEGLDVDGFLAKMDACCAPVFEDPPRPVDESRFPKIALTA